MCLWAGVLCLHDEDACMVGGCAAGAGCICMKGRWN